MMSSIYLTSLSKGKLLTVLLLGLFLSICTAPILAAQGRFHLNIPPSRLVEYSIGLIFDRQTGLMWSSEGGRLIDWYSAKEFSRTYRGGGYTDWRIPSFDELETLYIKDSNPYRRNILSKYVGGILDYIWGSETSGPRAAVFYYLRGRRDWGIKSDAIYGILLVRSHRK